MFTGLNKQWYTTTEWKRWNQKNQIESLMHLHIERGGQWSNKTFCFENLENAAYFIHVFIHMVYIFHVTCLQRSTHIQTSKKEVIVLKPWFSGRAPFPGRIDTITSNPETLNKKVHLKHQCQKNFEFCLISFLHLS